MRLEWRRIGVLIRNFLFSSVNKEFLIFLFFLFLSGSFWLSMTLDDTYEKEIRIPIRLVNIPKNTVITTELVDTLKVTIRDKGFALAGYLYGNRFRTINLNFETYANNATGKGHIPLPDIQNIIYQRLSTSSKIVGIKPDELAFYFSFGLLKQVPVRANGKLIPAQNYYLSRVRFWPESVTIYAQKNVLDSIQYVNTEELKITNFSDTVIQRVRLQHMVGVKTVPQTVRIGLYPDILTEESIEVPVTAVNMPEGKILRTFPARVKVLFNVGANVYRKINFTRFKVVVNYDELAEHPSDKCNIYLQTIPAEVQQARLEMTSVDYLLEQR